MSRTITIETTKAVSEILKDFNGVNKSTLTIAPAVIAQAIFNGYITEVGRKKQNIYYGFNVESLTGDILMHVRDNQYVVISKWVVREDNSIVEVLSLLMQYTFYIGTVSGNRNRGFVMISIKKANGSGYTTLYLHRLLTAIELNLKIEELNPDYHVHHKGDCFDDRQGMTMYIPKDKHKDKKSHMTGGEIRSIEEFIYFCGVLSRKYDELVWINCVA